MYYEITKRETWIVSNAKCQSDWLIPCQWLILIDTFTLVQSYQIKSNIELSNHVLKTHIKCDDIVALIMIYNCVHVCVCANGYWTKKEQSIERRSSMQSHRIASQHITFTFYYCPLDCKFSCFCSFVPLVRFLGNKILLEGTWEYFDKKKSLSNSSQKKKKN